MLNLIILLLSLIFVPVSYAGVLCDGADDVINYGDVTDLDGATALSIYIRLVFDSRTAGDVLVSKWGNSSSEQGFLFQIDNSASDELRYVVSDGAGSLYIRDSTSANLVNDTEYRILAVWDATNGMTVYVNGTSVSLTSILSGSVSSIPNVTSSLQICREVDSGGVNVLDGDVFEVAIWTSELGQAEADLLESGVARTYLQIDPTNLVTCPQLDSLSDGVSGDGFSFPDGCSAGLTGAGIDSTNNTGMLGVAERTHSYP